jgi:hypothetical protein
LPTTKFLFWNINGKPVANVVAELATAHKADVVIRAECRNDRASLLATLNSGTSGGFRLSNGVSKGITISTQFSSDFFRPAFESCGALPKTHTLLRSIYYWGFV